MINDSHKELSSSPAGVSETKSFRREDPLFSKSDAETGLPFERQVFVVTDKDKQLIPIIVDKIKSLNRRVGPEAVTYSFQELYDRAELTSEEILLFQRYATINPHDFGFKGKYLGVKEPPPDANRVVIAETQYSRERKKTDESQATITDEVTIPPQFVTKEVYDAYQKMNAAMAEDLGCDELLIESGYRSPSRQIFTLLDILASPEKNFDLGATMKQVAMPGYTQHGDPDNLAVDVMTTDGYPDDDNSTHVFQKRQEYKWLLHNAWKFGFKLSYPPNNPDGIRFEPWHWQYDKEKVGIPGEVVDVESRGHKLKGNVLLATGSEKKPMVLIGHGAAYKDTPIEYLVEMQKYLQERGYSSMVLQNQGVGMKDPYKSEGPYESTLKERAEDFEAAVKLLKEQYGQQELYGIFGSMNGHVACQISQEFSKLILIEPAAYRPGSEEKTIGTSEFHDYAWGRDLGVTTTNLDEVRRDERLNDSKMESLAFEALRQYRGQVTVIFGTEDTAIDSLIQQEYHSVVGEKGARGEYTLIDGRKHDLLSRPDAEVCKKIVDSLEKN